MASGGSPCGACKFLRRKCAVDCVFAPYFSSEQGPARFAAIHKVFGASNVSKLLLHVPVPERCEAVVTIAYEAQARIRDPVYGCVAHIFALQQQVACLQSQLMQVKAQLARTIIDSDRCSESQWLGNGMPAASNPMAHPTCIDSVCGASSMEATTGYEENAMLMEMQEFHERDDELSYQFSPRKRPSHGDLGELQALALKMMRN